MREQELGTVLSGIARKTIGQIVGETPIAFLGFSEDEALPDTRKD